MNHALAIFTPTGEDHDRELLAAVMALAPDRVTVLIEDPDPAILGEDSVTGAARRDRLAALMATIERETGATVVGLAGERAQLRGWHFDHELTARLPVAA